MIPSIMDRPVVLIIITCIWILLLWIPTSADDSCRNERHTICCNGLIYIRSGFRPACCGSVGYDSQHFMCCGRSIIHKGSKSRCCGNQGYDVSAQQCKHGYLVDRTGIGSTCCQSHSGWRCCRRGENCCSRHNSNEISSHSVVDVPGFRPACCSLTSSSHRAECCRTATEKAWLIPPCCDAEDIRPICCVKPDGDWHCCSPEEGYCCGPDSVRWTPDSHESVRPTQNVPSYVPSETPWNRQPERPTQQQQNLGLTTTTEMPHHRTPEQRTTVETPIARKPFRQRPECCNTLHRPTCCSTVVRHTYCCQILRNQLAAPSNQLSPVDRHHRPGLCCNTPYPNNFCCGTSGLNHPQRPRPINNCCAGRIRPTCCYSWYQRSHCCRVDLSSSDGDGGVTINPYAGQVSSCCSSSSKQKCCEHGLRMTGQMPMCCIVNNLSSTESPIMDESKSSVSSAEDEHKEEEEMEEDKEHDISVVLEEDEDYEMQKEIIHSCCGVDKSELNVCCANGFRKHGIQSQCCGRTIGSSPDKRGDIPGDLAYFYSADDPSEDGVGSCCNSSSADMVHCCREAYLTTWQVFGCCSLRPSNAKAQNIGTPAVKSSAKEQKIRATIKILSNGHDRYIHADGNPVSCCQIKYHNERMECCRMGITNRRYPHCCDTTRRSRKHLRHTSTLYHVRSNTSPSRLHHVNIQRQDYSRDICGSQLYDMRTHICCSGVLMIKQGIQPKCCGKMVYDAKLYHCCPGKIVSRYCEYNHISPRNTN